jgi:ADP-heptose:LPS heptosyltransferase
MKLKYLPNKIKDSWHRNIAVPLITRFIHFFISLGKRNRKSYKPRTLIILRFDAIGDYVLFRNFLEFIRNSEKYKGYHITLCGNLAWKSIAETFDKEFVDEFIWINFDKLYKEHSYRYEALKLMADKEGYEVLISSTAARNYYKEDAFVRAITAQEKIGYESRVWENMIASHKQISDKYYNRLISVADYDEFEFYLNQKFFRSLFGSENYMPKRTHFKPIPYQLKFSTPDQYAIIAPGAGAWFRRWSTSNFAKISDYLFEKYGIHSVIVGSKADKELANQIMEEAKNKNCFTDLTGISSLTDLVFLLQKSKITIANESSATHFAVAVDTPVICISNGNHFGRFNPYPEEIAPYCQTVYPPEITEKLEDKRELIRLYAAGSRLNINKVEPQTVVQAIEYLFQKLENSPR